MSTVHDSLSRKAQRRLALPLLTLSAVCLSSAVACSDNHSEPFGPFGMGGTAGTAGTAGSFILIGGNGNGNGSGGGAQGGAAGAGSYALPSGFTKTELGGWLLGASFSGDAPPASSGGSAGSNEGCGSTILGVVRDFNGAGDPDGHADFEAFNGSKPTHDMVETELGIDRKPVYTGICQDSGVTGPCPYNQQTTTKANFDEWYRYAASANKPYVLYLSLEPKDGRLTFQSHAFFPLDDAGWGNQNRNHNFHFSTEVHTEFKYNGGEVFTFIGDDDVWVFINGKLALDLGGLHPEATGSVDLDSQAGALGLEPGSTYPLDLFHAERHTDKSNFRIDTTLQFTNCGVIVAEPPPR